MVEVAGASRALRRRDRWGHPRRVGEIKELRHVHLRGVTLGEAGQAEARLDELKNCGVIGDRVRNVVLLGKRRDHNQRHAEAGYPEFTAGRVLTLGTDVTLWKIG